MKKILVLSIALAMLATSSFAAEVKSEDGKLVFGDSAKDTNLNKGGIGISPKVVAKYVTDGTDQVTAQWYAAATVHPGGNEAYATAQNLNNILKRPYSTGDDTASVLDTIPTAKASESDWASDWKVN